MFAGYHKTRCMLVLHRTGLLDEKEKGCKSRIGVGTRLQALTVWPRFGAIREEKSMNLLVHTITERRYHTEVYS